MTKQVTDNLFNLFTSFNPISKSPDYNPAKKGKEYSPEESDFLDRIAEDITTKEEMEAISPWIAAGMGRTIGGVQKQIEERKGWFYR